MQPIRRLPESTFCVRSKRTRLNSSQRPTYLLASRMRFRASKKERLLGNCLITGSLCCPCCRRVGKVSLGGEIGAALPPGSHAVVYDCFANGAYRNISAARHRHKEAFVQIGKRAGGTGYLSPIDSGFRGGRKSLHRRIYPQTESKHIIHASGESMRCFALSSMLQITHKWRQMNLGRGARSFAICCASHCRRVFV